MRKWSCKVGVVGIVLGVLLVPAGAWAVDGNQTAPAAEQGGEGGALDPVAAAREALAAKDGAETRVALGDALLQAGEVEEALTHYEKALALAPKHHPAQIGVARAKTAQGDFEGALAVLEEGVKLNPRPETMYYELGRVHEAAGQFEQAVGSYRKALERLLR